MSSLFSVEFVTPRTPFYPMLGVGSPRELQAGGNLASCFRAQLVRDPRTQLRAKEKAPLPTQTLCSSPYTPYTT
jgi:hypothetical protein